MVGIGSMLASTQAYDGQYHFSLLEASTVVARQQVEILIAGARNRSS